MLRGILALIVILLVIKVLSRMKLGNRTICFLGCISYEIYLTHGIVISAIASAFQNMRPGIFILSSIVVTIVISIGLNVLASALVRKLRT